MTNYIVFNRKKFARDVQQYTHETSTRYMSKMTGGRVASTTISRIQTGKTKEVSISTFLELCLVMNVSPTEYIVELPY